MADDEMLDRRPGGLVDWWTVCGLHVPTHPGPADKGGQGRTQHLVTRLVGRFKTDSDGDVNPGPPTHDEAVVRPCPPLSAPVRPFLTPDEIRSARHGPAARL